MCSNGASHKYKHWHINLCGGEKERSTVKLVQKDHPLDQQNVVVIHKWSLCRFNSMESIRLRTWASKMWFYKQMVFICRWCLEQVLPVLDFCGLLAAVV